MTRSWKLVLECLHRRSHCDVVVHRYAEPDVPRMFCDRHRWWADVVEVQPLKNPPSS